MKQPLVGNFTTFAGLAADVESTTDPFRWAWSIYIEGADACAAITRYGATNRWCCRKRVDLARFLTAVGPKTDWIKRLKPRCNAVTAHLTALSSTLVVDGPV